jgi:SAM-dependent methyltransferase
MSRLLKPGGRLILTTPYRHYRPLWGDKLSLTEDGGHVRWGYSHNELRNKIESVGMRVLSEDYISGVISQQLTSAMRRLNHNANGIGWIATLPFRVLQTIDGPITSLVDYPYLSIGIVAEKMPSV